jgi:hypothetical protein
MKFTDSRPWLWLGQVLVGGLAVCILVLRAAPPIVYEKDLQVIYLSALALRDGEDALAPVQQLAARYWPGRPGTSPLPNHLPPFLSLIGVPLTLLSFPVFATLWLAVNLVLLWLGARALGLSPAGGIALAAWPPAFWALDNGNLEVLILALLVSGWNAAREGRETRAGAWIGLAGAVKFYPLLFLVPFVRRRRARLLGAAALVVAAAQAANLLALGPSRLLFYYREVLPMGSELWLRQGLNSAPYGALLRLFGGAEDVGPVVAWPWLVMPALGALVLVAVIVFYKCEPEDAPAAAFMALPNVRGYFAVLLLPAIRRLLVERRSRIAILVCACVSFTLLLANLTTRLVRYSTGVPDGALSSLAAVLTAIQPAGYIGLALLCLQAARSEDRQTRARIGSGRGDSG